MVLLRSRWSSISHSCCSASEIHDIQTSIWVVDCSPQIFKGVKKEHNLDGWVVVYFRTWLHPDVMLPIKREKGKKFTWRGFYYPAQMSLHHQVWRKQKPEQMAKQRRLHTSHKPFLYLQTMQDGAGTLREQLCISDTAILILTQTHTPTRASEDSKRSSRTSNTSEIKPSFRCWDHQVTSQQVNLEKQCPPPPTSVESSSGCDKAEGSAAFCVWRSSQESCDKHTLPHKHTHFSWWTFRCCSEHPRLAALYLGTQRRGIVTTELQNCETLMFPTRVLCATHPPAAPGWHHLQCSRDWPYLLCSTLHNRWLCRPHLDTNISAHYLKDRSTFL